MKKDFEIYGETEQINLIKNKKLGFVNFLNIEDSIEALEKMKTNPLYSNLKLFFGKDRCNHFPTINNNYTAYLKN